MPDKWRTGGKIPLNVYEGDRPMFQCHTPEDAGRIVAMLNQVDRAVGDSLAAYLGRSEEWSARTFGHGLRTKGIVQHIQKELAEILEKPHDLSEWVDVMILAMDGYWRHGGDPKEIMQRLQLKQDVNFARQWPPIGPEDQAMEHVKDSVMSAQEGPDA
jgi:hypothetical protein